MINKAYFSIWSYKGGISVSWYCVSWDYVSWALCESGLRTSGTFTWEDTAEKLS